MRKKIIKLALLSLTGAIILFIGYHLLFPKVSKLNKENPRLTSFMKIRQQEWQEQNNKTSFTQSWVPLARISPYLINAVLIAEDDKFYQHRGFDWEALRYAFRKNMKRKRLSFGGSTITQQLTKNLYFGPSKNPLRKLREAIIAWRLERSLSKKRILELYLNVVEWGPRIFGVEAASRHYFDKTASSLSPEESARLAAILPNPHKYKIFKANGYVDQRSREILKVMVKRGIVVLEYIPAY